MITVLGGHTGARENAAQLNWHCLHEGFVPVADQLAMRGMPRRCLAVT